MQLEAGGIRRAIAFPIASDPPQTESNRPAAADRTLASRGTRSRRDRRCGDRFDTRLAAEPAPAPTASRTRRQLVLAATASAR
jgi:hypothetical protein